MEQDPTAPEARPVSLPLAQLVAAQGVSVTGDAVLLTAASIVVFRETGSATAVSVLLGIAALPAVLFGPIAGAFADRFPRRRIMVTADLLSALVCMAAVGLNHLVATEAAAFASLACVSVLGTFFRPAAQALLPSLTSEAGLARANSALRLATSLANIGGPASAAFATGRAGLDLVLWADGASFLCSAALVAGIRAHGADTGRARGPSTLAQARAGLSYALASSRIRTVALTIGVVMLVGTLVNAGTLPLVSGPLGLEESRYGTLLAIEGAGAMLLATLFVAFGPGPRLLVTGAFAVLGVGASTLALAAANRFGVAAAALFTQGASVVALQVAFASYLQRESEDAYRGRVMALVGMVASVAMLAGYALAGPVVDLAGVRTAFSFAGAVILIAAVPVVALAFRAAREETVSASPA